MKKRLLMGVMTLVALMAQMGAASACSLFGYQPSTPKSLQK